MAVILIYEKGLHEYMVDLLEVIFATSFSFDLVTRLLHMRVLDVGMEEGLMS